MHGTGGFSTGEQLKGKLNSYNHSTCKKSATASVVTTIVILSMIKAENNGKVNTCPAS